MYEMVVTDHQKEGWDSGVQIPSPLPSAMNRAFQAERGKVWKSVIHD